MEIQPYIWLVTICDHLFYFIIFNPTLCSCFVISLAVIRQLDVTITLVLRMQDSVGNTNYLDAIKSLRRLSYIASIVIPNNNNCYY